MLTGVVELHNPFFFLYYDELAHVQHHHHRWRHPSRPSCLCCLLWLQASQRRWLSQKTSQVFFQTSSPMSSPVCRQRQETCRQVYSLFQGCSRDRLIRWPSCCPRAGQEGGGASGTRAKRGLLHVPGGSRWTNVHSRWALSRKPFFFASDSLQDPTFTCPPLWPFTVLWGCILHPWSSWSFTKKLSPNPSSK